MNSVSLSVRYSGGFAEHGAIEANCAERAIKGARQVLSAHGNFCASRDLPRRLGPGSWEQVSNRVLVLPPAEGSWEILAGLVVPIVGAGLGKVWGQFHDEFLASSVELFLKDLKRRGWLVKEMRKERIEPYWRRELDPFHEGPAAYDQLQRHTQKGLKNIISPLQNSATAVHISVGEDYSWTVKQTESTFDPELVDEIATAVKELRKPRGRKD